MRTPIKIEVPTTEQDLYTAPDKGSILELIRVGNDTGSAITVHLRLVAPADADDTTRIVKLFPAIQVDSSGGVVDDDTGWPMKPGWKMTGYASAVGLALILKEFTP